MKIIFIQTLDGSGTKIQTLNNSMTLMKRLQLERITFDLTTERLVWYSGNGIQQRWLKSVFIKTRRGASCTKRRHFHYTIKSSKDALGTYLNTGWGQSPLSLRVLLWSPPSAWKIVHPPQSQKGHIEDFWESPSRFPAIKMLNIIQFYYDNIKMPPNISFWCISFIKKYSPFQCVKC